MHLRNVTRLRGEVLGDQRGPQRPNELRVLLQWHHRGPQLALHRILHGPVLRHAPGHDHRLLESQSARQRRGRLVSYVPQSPGTALNPSMRIGDAVAEMIRAHREGAEPASAVPAALTRVHLPDESEFQRRYPKNDRINRPRVATIIDNVDTTTSDDTPVRRVRFYPAPDKSYAIPYSYVTKNLVVSSSNVAKEAFTADADEPIVPKRARQAIVYKALSQWYRDKKDDVRSQQANAEYVDLVTRVVNDQEIGASRPQLRPRMGTYSRRASAPWGGPGGRYDVNGWFDRMEDR